jgi:hypothetical protein
MTDSNAGRSYQRGMDRPAAKLTDQQIIDIRQAVAHGVKQVDVAAAYGISQGLVSGIVNGHRWRHVDGPIRLTNTTEQEK